MRGTELSKYLKRWHTNLCCGHVHEEKLVMLQNEKRYFWKGIFYQIKIFQWSFTNICILILEKINVKKKISDLFLYFTISVGWKNFLFLNASNIVSGLDHYYRKDVNSASWKNRGKFFKWMIFKEKIFLSSLKHDWV